MNLLLQYKSLNNLAASSYIIYFIYFYSRPKLFLHIKEIIVAFLILKLYIKPKTSDCDWKLQRVGQGRKIQYITQRLQQVYSFFKYKKISLTCMVEKDTLGHGQAFCIIYSYNPPSIRHPLSTNWDALSRSVGFSTGNLHQDKTHGTLVKINRNVIVFYTQ